MTLLPSYLDATQDGRQSQAASDICRGVGRTLKAYGFAAVSEVTLASGRRADVVGISGQGAIWIVEIKSSIEDFRSDQKWPEYREFCDRLLFAVAPAFPQEILPPDTGLIVADRYGGELIRPAPEHKLSSPGRKAMTLCVARAAASRLQAVLDPEGGFEALARV
jgi:hypothetical protein